MPKYYSETSSLRYVWAFNCLKNRPLALIVVYICFIFPWRAIHYIVVYIINVITGSTCYQLCALVACMQACPWERKTAWPGWRWHDLCMTYQIRIQLECISWPFSWSSRSFCVMKVVFNAWKKSDQPHYKEGLNKCNLLAHTWTNYFCMEPDCHNSENPPPTRDTWLHCI